jgi:DnaJ-class molecular chaperone
VTTLPSDPYAVLGVERGADARAIKSAFRRLARQHHPDLNPGDEGAGARFIEIAAAFEILNDEGLRARFDEFGVEGLAEGFDVYSARRDRAVREELARQDAERQAARSGGFGLGDIPGFESVFGEAFRSYNPFNTSAFKDAVREDPYAARGKDLYSELEVDVGTAIRGGAVSFAHKGSVIAVRIPPGTEDGQELLVEGEGEPLEDGEGLPGDLWLTVRVPENGDLTREGLDLVLRCPVSITEALLGAKITVPTLRGDCIVTLPEGVHSGTRLRLKGMGVEGEGGARGDMYVLLEIRAPTRIDDAIRAAARAIEEGYEAPLRANLKI